MEAYETMQQNLAQIPISIQVIAGSLIVGLIYYYITGERPYAGIPTITSDRRGWEHLLPAAFAWIKDGKKIQAKGHAVCSGPFQVRTGTGYKIIVPNRFADELKSHPSLNFNEAFAKDLFVEYPGFDGTRQGLQDETFLQEVVRVKLTQSLGLVTDDLVDETATSLHDESALLLVSARRAASGKDQTQISSLKRCSLTDIRPYGRFCSPKLRRVKIEQCCVCCTHLC